MAERWFMWGRIKAEPWVDGWSRARTPQVLVYVKIARPDHSVMSAELGETDSLLSKSERQRIAIARALVRQPQILILDEITSSLDAHSENQVRRLRDATRPWRPSTFSPQVDS